jgi:hypothetical protein
MDGRTGMNHTGSSSARQVRTTVPLCGIPILRGDLLCDLLCRPSTRCQCSPAPIRCGGNGHWSGMGGCGTRSKHQLHKCTAVTASALQMTSAPRSLPQFFLLSFGENSSVECVFLDVIIRVDQQKFVKVLKVDRHIISEHHRIYDQHHPCNLQIRSAQRTRPLRSRNRSPKRVLRRRPSRRLDPSETRAVNFVHSQFVDAFHTRYHHLPPTWLQTSHLSINHPRCSPVREEQSRRASSISIWGILCEVPRARIAQGRQIPVMRAMR